MGCRVYRWCLIFGRYGKEIQFVGGVGRMAGCLFIEGGISKVYLDDAVDEDVNHTAGTALVELYISKLLQR